MFLAHLLLPFGIFYFYTNTIMLLGLLLGNLVDLDHLYPRITGKMKWKERACPKFGKGLCGFGIYPCHSKTAAITFLVISILIFTTNIYFQMAGWIGFGAFLNLSLDYLHQKTGFGF